MSCKNKLMLFAGNATPELAAEISEKLEIPLVQMTVSKFSNGETRVEIKENCRGCDAFIIQSICSSHVGTVNDNLMELHVIASALRGSSAQRITAVIPIYGYARQDKKDRSRAAITARLVAKHIEADGVDRVITVDLHASQIQGFFDIPVDNLYSESLLVNGILELAEKHGNNIVIVSPDAGGAKRAIRVAKKLGVNYAIISKSREEANIVSDMELNGDVRGKVGVIVDDMADTCGTLIMAADTLKSNGTIENHAFVAHGVLSGPALPRLNSCDNLHSLVVTNTIRQIDNQAACPKIKVISIAGLLADSILRTHNEESVSALFEIYTTKLTKKA